MNARETHKLLANQNIRLFNIKIGHNPELQVIHPNKDVKTFRKDIRNIIDEISEVEDNDGNSSDDIFYKFGLKLIDYGYHEIEEIISDVYEGRIANYKSRIEDDPVHEDQKDGFGHWGLESKCL